MPHLIQVITNCLLQLLPWFIGPFGGLIISVISNIAFFILTCYLLNQLSVKDKKINDLINDLKLLIIKSEVSSEEFKELIENKFFSSAYTPVDKNESEKNAEQ